MKNKVIESFDLSPGRVLLNKYVVERLVGAGLEGEVYQVRERLTNKMRALKLFFPHRDQKFKVSNRIAKKLDKLDDSPIVVDYVSYQVITLKGYKVACLITEFIEGEILSDFVNKHRMKRLGVFPAIHLLYSLSLGIESIHLSGEYHGDLHVDNIIIKKFGLEFDLKIIDLHHWGDSKKDNREEDIVKLVRIFYDILGGEKRYKYMPNSIKYIISGLKRTLILKKFKTITDLRFHLEELDWSDAIS